MVSWECGVCGYIHKEDEPPETCPICEAPKKMFSELVEEEKAETTEAPAEDSVAKKWRCTVCGYVHTGAEPPEKCPVCHAPAAMFEEVAEGPEESAEETPDAGDAEAGDAADAPAPPKEKRWRCTVCGYIHKGGDAPPEKCPVCGAPQKMFVEVDAKGKAMSEAPVEELVAIGKIAEDKAGKAGSEGTAELADDDYTDDEETEGSDFGLPAREEELEKKSFFELLSAIVMKFHLHPITVHFPNGIIPVVLVFFAIGYYFNIAVMEQAAFYNLIFILVTLPVVIFTGYAEWKGRYMGIKTAIFITKIICSIVVLGSVGTLVIWRVIDPGVAAAGAPHQLIYYGIAALMLLAAGIAGHLGGKLVFAARG